MNFYKWMLWWIGMPMTSLAISFGSSFPVAGVQTSDGTVAFEAGLRLLNTSTTFNDVRVRQARYYFDLELPADIGEPLQKIVIQQRTGGDEIEFNPEKTEVYFGERRDRGESLNAIAKVNENQVKGAQTADEIEIRFEPPIPPGNKITIGIKPKKNPRYAGVYLFGVTAFPNGEKTRGMYLGSGRLHFYRNDGFHF